MAEIATLNENGKLVVPTGFKPLGIPIMGHVQPCDRRRSHRYHGLRRVRSSCATHYAMVSKLIKEIARQISQNEALSDAGKMRSRKTTKEGRLES